VVRYDPPVARSGPDRVAGEHTKVKWHVETGGRFGYEDFTHPDFIGAKSFSLLQRLQQARVQAPGQIAAQAAACGTSKMSGASPTSAWRAPAFVSASGTPPSDTATMSGPSRALALQFAHPHLGHESKYAPIITRPRKEPCP